MILIALAGEFRKKDTLAPLRGFLPVTWVWFESHSSAIFTSSLCFCAREMRRGVGIAGEGVHVGRACALTFAVSAPRQILVAPRVRVPDFSLDWLSSEYG